MINVTKTYLPPLAEYNRYLKRIWSSRWVTNNGPLVVELEKRLKTYLGVKHLFFVSNGTIALQLAIKALGLTGRVITTPFSYVASTSSLVWEGCRPDFVDIDPASLCIDVDRIEEAVTSRTQAILAVHVYGNTCNVEKIQSVARRHRLKVIYDASHAFGVTHRGKSLLRYGDVSTISFHATKLFHTIEGGAVVTGDDEIARKISYMRDFGHDGTERFFGLGVNGKNTELHAAMGLCILPKVKAFIARRKVLSNLYSRVLKSSPLTMPLMNPGSRYNYAYYPVVFPSEKSMLRARKLLWADGIYPRRYFYPSLSALPYVISGDVPISENVSKRVLCVPLYVDLRERDVRRVAALILKSFAK